MCGIVFAYDPSGKSVNEAVRQRLADQIGRGQKGFGIAFFWKDKPAKMFRATELVDALIELRFTDAPGILLHHRQPTSSPNLLSQTHPIRLQSPKNGLMLEWEWLCCHNGVISNDLEVKADHEDMGYKYITELPDGRFNDSECVALETALAYEDKEDCQLESRTKGSVASIALRLDPKTKIAMGVVYGRNIKNPLKLHKEGGVTMLASEGIGKDVEEGKLLEMAFSGKPKAPRDLEWKDAQVARGTLSDGVLCKTCKMRRTWQVDNICLDCRAIEKAPKVENEKVKYKKKETNNTRAGFSYELKEAKKGSPYGWEEIEEVLDTATEMIAAEIDNVLQAIGFDAYGGIQDDYYSMKKTALKEVEALLDQTYADLVESPALALASGSTK